MTAPIELATDADIAEALRLAAAATPPPWEQTYAYNNAGMPTADFKIPGHNGGATVEILAADAEFIVAARALLPRLAAHLAALQAGARATVAHLERAADEQSALARAHREEPDEWVHDAAETAYTKAAEMVAALCGDGPTDLVLVPSAELARLRGIPRPADLPDDVELLKNIIHHMDVEIVGVVADYDGARAEIKRLRATDAAVMPIGEAMKEIDRLRAIEAIRVPEVEAALQRHAVAVGVVGPMPKDETWVGMVKRIEDIDAAAEAEVPEPVKTARPRVGPWVRHVEGWAIHDAHGVEVAFANEEGFWWARRPFDAVMTGDAEAESDEVEDAAKAAAVAVLATWADIPCDACDGSGKIEVYDPVTETGPKPATCERCAGAGVLPAEATS